MLKYIFGTFFLLLLTNPTVAQNKRIIDSLYTVEKNTSSPKDKLPILYTLIKSLRYRDSSECDQMGNKGIFLSQQLKDKHYESLFLSTLAIVYYYNNDIIKFKNALNKAFELASTNNDEIAKAQVWIKWGAYYMDRSKKDSALHYLLSAEDELRTIDGECQTKAIIYYNLAKFYSDQFLNEKSGQYCKLALANATICNDVDVKVTAYFANAYTYSNIYNDDTAKFRQYRDSTLLFYHLIFQSQQDSNLAYTNVVANSLYNVGNLYYDLGTKQGEDSANYYFEAVKKMNATSVNQFILCLMQLKQTKIHLKNKHLAEAKILLDEIPTRFAFLLENIEILAKFYDVQYLYAKQTNNVADALRYKELSTSYFDSLYSQEKVALSQKTETQFKNYKQEQELIVANEQIAIKRKLNFFYLAIAIVSLLSLVFMFRSYYFKQRDLMKTNALLEKEKQEAELQTKLKEEEAMNAIMEKELADQDRLVAIQEKLLTEQQKEKLQQELMSNRLQLDRKNEFLKEIKGKLPNLKTGDSSDLKQISKTVDKSLEADEEFDLLKSSFENTNPKFFTTLQEKAVHTLTKLDLKYCGYIKLGMSTKEIATLMNIEPKSMRMARYRIKQKLTLDKEQDLDSFILAI
jgi:DNA-binding CsgD family transcriptional regulator